MSCGVYNVLDARVEDPANGEHSQTVIPQDGRAFRITLRQSF